jgi:hypothetical protein
VLEKHVPERGVLIMSKRLERIKRKVHLVLDDVSSIGISERSLMQELLDLGASKPEADELIQEMVSCGKVERESMGYLKVTVG